MNVYAGQPLCRNCGRVEARHTAGSGCNNFEVLTSKTYTVSDLRELADCSPERCHDGLLWAAKEIERLRDIINPGDAAAYEESMAAKEAQEPAWENWSRDQLIGQIKHLRSEIKRLENEVQLGFQWRQEANDLAAKCDELRRASETADAQCEPYLKALTRYADGYYTLGMKYGMPAQDAAFHAKHMQDAVLGLRRILGLSEKASGCQHDLQPRPIPDGTKWCAKCGAIVAEKTNEHHRDLSGDYPQKTRDCLACNVGNPGVYVKDGVMYCPHRPESPDVERQLAEDVLIFGAAYCRIDNDGTKTRLHPRTVMVDEQPTVPRNG